VVWVRRLWLDEREGRAGGSTFGERRDAPDRKKAKEVEIFSARNFGCEQRKQCQTAKRRLLSYSCMWPQTVIGQMMSVSFLRRTYEDGERGVKIMESLGDIEESSLAIQERKNVDTQTGEWLHRSIREEEETKHATQNTYASGGRT
jgi:hypothetical protein